MTPFDKFRDYLFFLLFAPLKKVHKLANQLYIFFKAIGGLLDEMKQDVFRVREEVSIASASTSMLLVHGQDHGMPRLEGEDWELYRTRLLMHGIVAAQAGTTQGIISLIKSLGYETVYLEPYYLTDPSRWSEAIVWISGGNVVIEDRDIIQQEIDKIKPASSLIHLGHEQVYAGDVFVAVGMDVYKIIDVEMM